MLESPGELEYELKHQSPKMNVSKSRWSWVWTEAPNSKDESSLTSNTNQFSLTYCLLNKFQKTIAPDLSRYGSEYASCHNNESAYVRHHILIRSSSTSYKSWDKICCKFADETWHKTKQHVIAACEYHPLGQNVFGEHSKTDRYACLEVKIG